MPIDEYDADDSVLEIKKDKTIVMVAAVTAEIILNHFSSLSKCIRIAAWCLHFKNNAVLKNIKCSGSLSACESDNAKMTRIKKR